MTHMPIPVRIEDSSQPQPQPKRRTQRWVKVMWLLASMCIVVVGFLILRPVETTPLSTVPQPIHCGSVVFRDEAAVMEWASLSEVKRLGLKAGVSTEKAGSGYCSEAFGVQLKVAGWFVGIAVALGLAGLIGRARPSVPVRIVG